jgi:O-acetyl-ADP-ribose deacetylase (regulator of RNase III)
MSQKVNGLSTTARLTCSPLRFSHPPLAAPQNGAPPIGWHDAGATEAAHLLRSCYTESLRLAEQAGLETIAFPGISTGAYDYPKDQACEVAVKAVSSWLATHDLPRTVTFCCFSAADAGLYRRCLGAAG